MLKSDFSLGANSAANVKCGETNANNFSMDRKSKKVQNVNKPKLKGIVNLNVELSETNAIKSSTHKEEKVALILLIIAEFTTWWMLK